MKKLLALLALAGFTSAFAQSSVQLFGNIDQGMYRGTYADKSMTSTGSNVGSTSFWGIKGSENLGGGTTANFELRSEITLNSGAAGSSSTGISGTDSRSSTIFNRGAWIGLSNPRLGAVQLGRQPNAFWEETMAYNNTGINSYGFAGLTAITMGANSQHLLYNGTDLTGAGKALSFMGASSGNPSWTGTAESFIGGISYTTPTVGGFTGKLQTGTLDPSYTAAQSANNTKGASLNYKAGNLRLGWAYDAKTDANGATAYTQRMLGATYALSNGYKVVAARTYTGFGSLPKSQGAHEMVLTGFGVGKSSGRWDYNAGVSKLVDAEDNSNAVRMLGATARYNFSKQTSWYVGVGQAKNTGNSRIGPVYAPASTTIPTAGDVGQTVNSLLTGVRYQF